MLLQVLNMNNISLDRLKDGEIRSCALPHSHQHCSLLQVSAGQAPSLDSTTISMTYILRPFSKPML